jgi:hypothetical protein
VEGGTVEAELRWTSEHVNYASRTWNEFDFVARLKSQAGFLQMKRRRLLGFEPAAGVVGAATEVDQTVYLCGVGIVLEGHHIHVHCRRH